MSDKNKISQLVRERLEEKKAPQPQAATQPTTVTDGGGNYDKIAAILNNPLVNTAEISRQLWGDEDQDTNRSLFKKKLDRAANGNGSTYKFDDQELQKIQSVLMNFSTQIRKTIGRQGS